jgi:hypothetical protein
MDTHFIGLCILQHASAGNYQYFAAANKYDWALHFLILLPHIGIWLLAS